MVATVLTDESAIAKDPKKKYAVDKIFNIPEGLINREGDDLRPPAVYRSQFMRDRDRLMYSPAFRRLSGKTQIYTVGTADHLQNRLTHTLEVAQIAKTIAIALDLNADLAEAIAIGHDFGHTPFGHAGEEMLHEIMSLGSPYIDESPFSSKKGNPGWFPYVRKDIDVPADWSPSFGFKHNIQSVRLVTRLENSYVDNNKNTGLNLTNFTLFGMMRHSSMMYANTKLDTPSFQNDFKQLCTLKGTDIDAWSFEAYIVEIADDIAQWHHDLEDALREGALTIKHICELVAEALFPNGRSYNDGCSYNEIERLETIAGKPYLSKASIREICSIVVNALVTDLIEQSYENFNILHKSVKAWQTNHPGETTNISEKLFIDFDKMGLKDENGDSIKKGSIIAFSSSIKKDTFKKSIKESIHHSRNVERMNTKGRYIIRKLFDAYFSNPHLLPDNSVRFLMSQIKGEAEMAQLNERGIGAIRSEFNKIWKDSKEHSTIYQQAMLMRTICDHIASMTDRYAIDEFERLYG